MYIIIYNMRIIIASLVPLLPTRSADSRFGTVDATTLFPRSDQAMSQVFSSYVESKTGRLVRAMLITGPLETMDGVRTYQEDWTDCKMAPSPSDFIGDVLLTGFPSPTLA